jgi:tRNA(Ile)-lysidine synthase
VNSLSLFLNLPIIVAVSGGADSLCLLGALHEQGYPLIVAHFDHQLRPDSVDDAKFVEEIAAQYQLPFVMGIADVNAYAKEYKQTIEEAARNCRYAFFFTQARIHKAQAVAVGHTADDQVETVLMHFLRGAGLNGLKGILPSTILLHFDAEIPLVRPILNLRRADTEAWCAEHDLVPREDPTNAETDYFRNKLRHNLIPELENYNPRFRESVIRTSQALQGDHALLDEFLNQTWQQVVNAESPTYISFLLSTFSSLSPALIRNLIRHGMEKLLSGQADISFVMLERAVDFIVDANASARVDLLSGFFLLKEDDVLYLTADEKHLPVGDFPQMRDEIASAVLLPHSDEEIRVDLGDGWLLTASNLETGQAAYNADPFQVTFDADALVGALSLRGRRPGDRFSPLGMGNQSVKLTDFFINMKVPRRAREKYPLLCDENGVTWVPGYRMAQRVRVTDATTHVIRFVLKRW